MKKNIVLAAILLWCIAAVNLMLNTEKRSEEKVIRAFAMGDYSESSAKLSGVGKLWNEKLGVEDSVALVTRIKDELMWSNVTVSSKMSGKRLETVCARSDDMGEIRVYCDTDCTYVFIDEITENMGNVLKIKSRINDAFEKNKMNSQISIIMNASVNGYMDYASKNIMCDALFRKIGADIVSENRDNDMFVVYGYTENISEYINILNEKVNVNLAITFDEEKNVTKIILATPINNMDF